jgi:protein TonB
VVVKILIDEKGNVISARAISGPPALYEVVVKAALKAKFTPTILAGQPVKVSATINYTFSL